jgi:hypothetical protein
VRERLRISLEDVDAFYEPATDTRQHRMATEYGSLQLHSPKKKVDFNTHMAGELMNQAQRLVHRV